MDITNYIKYIAFDEFTPPGETKHSSFLKECRLGHVLLNRSGRLIEGYLTRRRHQSRKYHTQGLNDFQGDCLLQLTKALREEGFDLLCSNIEGYLKADLAATRPTRGETIHGPDGRLGGGSYSRWYPSASGDLEACAKCLWHICW